MHAAQPAISDYITTKVDRAIAAGILRRIVAEPAHYNDGVIERDYIVPSWSRAEVTHTVTIRPVLNQSRCTCEASTTHRRSWCSHRELVVRYERRIARRLNGGL